MISFRVVFILGACLGVSACSDPLVANTGLGQVRGQYATSRAGRQIVEFLGIHYAKAPTGDLRFRSPQSPAKWDGVFNATAECSDCVQQYTLVEALRTVVSGAEDCLCLNVFTPSVAPSAKLPVIVWIHGGAYVGGSGAKLLYGSDLLLDKDVVLVSMNYRLGLMGFLSTGDSVVPGNFGMKDQALALKWVKENIASFGGDPDSITLFGESAGAASINLHQYSPLSEGLFHKAIQDSGSVSNPWAFTSPEVLKGRTEVAAEMVGCPTAPSSALLKCMQALPAETIVNTTHKFLIWGIDPIASWTPTVEVVSSKGAFLTEDPRTSKKVLRKPLLTGFNNAEGGLKSVPIAGGSKSTEEFARWNKEFDTLTPEALIYNNTKLDSTANTRAIRKFYFGSDSAEITPDMLKQIGEMYGDIALTMGVFDTVEKHNGPTFLYYYNYNKTFSMCPLVLLGVATPNPGACHFDELTNFFPLQGFAPKYDASNTDADYNLSVNLIDLWVNFAKSGNPSTSTVTWDPVQSDALEYLEISKDGFTMKANPIKERRAFLKHLKASSKGRAESGSSENVEENEGLISSLVNGILQIL